MRFRGAIFDLDGTLLDSMGMWDDIDVAFLSRRGLTVPDDYVQAIVPLSFRETAFPSARTDRWYIASGAASLVVVVPCALLPHAARDTVMHTASAVAKNFFIITLSSSRFYAPYKNKTV